jgi:hypothetical protein
MKKFGKIFLITAASIIAVLLVIISVALYLVFTPERFTPVVRKQVDKFLTCKSELGEVELTFFSTFPNFGIKIRQFALINPDPDAQSDTLLRVDELVGVIDAAAWWEKNELIVKGLELTGGSVNIFSDSLGKTNYDIVASDTTTHPEAETETISPGIELRNIELNDVDLNYKDLALKLNTTVLNLIAKISGTISADNISGEIKVKRSLISFAYDGEQYLKQALVQFDIPVDMIPSRQFITLKNAKASINNLEFLLNGSIENDTLHRNIITDLRYEFASWPVSGLLALVPPSSSSYLKGIEAEGLLSSQGSIKGIFNDSVMPMLNIHLLMEKGAVKYTGFPLPVHDIEGDITFRTDLKTDSVSFVKIRQFSARTPLSDVKIEGVVHHLFTDPYLDLSATAALKLDEFNPMIPDSMKLDMKGNLSGRIKSAFSMSQMKQMKIERMKLSGSVTLSDLNVDFDSLSLNTNRSKIDFSLPNYKALSKNTRFAFATIETDNIEVSKLESYSASLQNASVSFETSDARDTTRIPDFICSFKLDSLSARMDSMSIAIAKPLGRVSVSPRSGKPDQPGITVSYNSEHLKTLFGQSSYSVNTLSLDAEIVNDDSQKDIFLKWLVKGFIDMNQGTLYPAGFRYPVEIPSLKMDFEPETFSIKDSRIKIDKSDFGLTGNLNNILSYFKGDSILRGKFNFVSNNTDISQLMALTSGIGYQDSTVTEKMEKTETSNTDSTYTGPYMVPKKVDLVLNASIKMATMGVDTATNISGDVRVHDGILVLDGLTFDTPAARMQLTAIYRTPRKNHLFLGLDYHMLDIEISQLLTMIPDIDTLMPMLRSFSGKGEFHIAVETYLDSLYNIKKSTLRGASSIKGNDLVLMDGETFSEIAKTLRFSKKTQNKVDTLSVEFTIFKNEIDVYPFLLVMDKYKAVIVGRHNFDMTFNYHISVVDCPLPVKLGVDVTGNETDLSYKPARCRYAAYYRPSSRHAVENKRLELRKMIREALEQKVKD